MGVEEMVDFLGWEEPWFDCFFGGELVFVFYHYHFGWEFVELSEWFW